MTRVDQQRRRFIAYFTAAGLGATLAPGILWAQLRGAGARDVTLDMVTGALNLAGVEMSEADRRALVEGANQNLKGLGRLEQVPLAPGIAPPFHFSPYLPGMESDRSERPLRLGKLAAVRRPERLEDVAFWPVRRQAELLRTRQISSRELTHMYLARARRFNPLLNDVVTLLDDEAMAAAASADREIAAGRYRGPLHGIPWGAKDILSARGHPTTWGSARFERQVFDEDASVVELLREAGAVLMAKLATGEMAGGDRWFGGQTRNPWNPAFGSDGSSAGSASATAAGCVAFSLGTETSGSILTPSARCGVAGLRPTFGRVSRHGAMTVAWTMDRVGPMCRYAEDAAIVLKAIARPDGRDMSVTDRPFNWQGDIDVAGLKVGIVQPSFDEIADPSAKRNARAALTLLRSAGVAALRPVTVPSLPAAIAGFPAIGAIVSIERTAYLDKFFQSGRMDEATGVDFRDGWLVSAPTYLQLQRGRMLVMTELAEATSAVDVYLVGSNNTGLADTPLFTPGSAAERAFATANLAGYPAINLPTGFADNGCPTNLVIVGRPYREAEVIALAKAYQDLAGFHERKPSLERHPGAP